MNQKQTSNAPPAISVSQRRYSIVYWNDIPTPYMEDRFDAADVRREYAFSVWYSRARSAGRSWVIDQQERSGPTHLLPRFMVGKLSVAVPFWRLLVSRPDVVVFLHHEPMALPFLILARILGVKAGFWTEKTFDSWRKRSALKEGFKRVLYGIANFCVVPGPDGEAFVRRYSKSIKCYWLPHSINVTHFAKARDPNLRAPARERFGVTGLTFLYVGRIIEIKGLAALVDGFIEASKTAPDLELLIVGDGDRFDHYKELAGLANAKITLVPFIQRDELLFAYAAADLFVFPTLGDPYGLVVDEALIAGLPVLSSPHAGELARRVRDGTNGMVVQDCTALGWARAMLKAQMIGLRRTEPATSLMPIEFDPEAWAQRLGEIVCQHICAEKPQSSLQNGEAE